MSKEHKFIFNDTVVAVEEQYRGDLGCVMFGKKLKDGNINVFLETYSPSIVEFFVELQKYITDLEAKLAESEKEVDFYKERYSTATTSAYGADLMAKDYQWHLEKEIAELKQQLAEKDAELNRYAELFGMKDKDFYVVEKVEYDKMKQGVKEIVEELKQQLAEKEKENQQLKDKLHTAEQETLHFQNKYFAEKQIAIEELEKVKDIIYRFDVSYDEINNLTISLDNYTNGFHKAKFKATILIDQQIKELKEKN